MLYLQKLLFSEGTFERCYEPAKTLKQNIAYIKAKPVDIENLDCKYKVSILFEEDVSNFKLPDGLRIIGTENDKVLRTTSENRLLYTAQIKNAAISKRYINSIGNTLPKNVAAELSFECTFKISTPGEPTGCGGTCSEESILGGETIFCACLSECTIGWR